MNREKPAANSRKKNNIRFHCFVNAACSFFQSATLLSGQEQPEPKSVAVADDSSSEEDEEEEDQKLDLSSTFK